jgi:hypothetical protein
MKTIVSAMILTVSTFAGAMAQAEIFDGKRSLLCSAFRVFECDLAGGCNAVSPEELGIAGAWIVDFRKKSLTGTHENSRPNAIDRVELLDGKLFLSGIQDGLPDQRDGVAWSASISQPDGVMTLTVAGERVGYVGLGSCVPSE